MGYSGVEVDSLGSVVKSISYTESFNDFCPIYMLYGMSYDEFWYDDLFKVKYYRECHKLKQKQKDSELWEQGMYIYEAILECAPILHPFSKAKQPSPYTEKPHHILQEEKNREATEQERENERLKGLLWMKNWVRNMKKQ